MLENPKDLIEVSALTRALNIFSDRWAFLILRDAFRNVNRFGGFLESLGIPRQTLLTRLEMLADQKIIYKRPIKEGRIIFEYKLTPMGLDLYPYAVSIWQWYMCWFPEETVLDSSLKHKNCGHGLQVMMKCQACDGKVEMKDIAIEAGPGAGMDVRPTQRKGRRSWGMGPDAEAQRALSVVCDRWNNLILGAIFSNVQNFEAIQNSIGIAPNTLSDRLKTLVEMDILKPTRKNSGSRFASYIPTQKGLDFFPCLFELASWGNRWLMGWNGPAAIPIHKTCGDILHSKIVCAHCKQEIHPQDVVAGNAPKANILVDLVSIKKEKIHAN